jgi:hypothetical protein
MLDATVPNGQSYLWSPGGQTTAVIQVDTTGYGLGQQLLTVTVNDFNNCATTDTVKVTFFDCTGIEESDRSLALELYPNPNAGVFTLRSNKLPNGAYMLRVFNSINTMVYKQDRVIIDGTLQYPVDLQHLPSGMYLLRLDSHTYGWTKQFIISK